MGLKYGPRVAGPEWVLPTCSGHLHSHCTTHLPSFPHYITTPTITVPPVLCLREYKQTLQAGVQQNCPVQQGSVSPKTVQ